MAFFRHVSTSSSDAGRTAFFFMMSLLSRVGRRAVQSSVRPIRLHHERLRVDLERNIVGPEFQADDEDHGVGSLVEHEGRVEANALDVDATEGRGGRTNRRSVGWGKRGA